MGTYCLKFVLAGSANSGKTSLYKRFTNKGYVDDNKSTVGMEFSARDIPFERVIIRAQLWDTAGQERFDAMTKYYYRDACGAYLVFDVNDRVSYDQAKTVWLKQIRDYGHENMCVLLVGNKADGANTRQVTTEEAIEFAKSSNLDYIECSAKDNINTEVAFRRPVLLAASFFPEIQDSLVLTGLPDGYMVINDVNDVSKSSYCNYWLNEKQSTIPTTSASTGLLYEADKVNFTSSAYTTRASSSGQHIVFSNNSTSSTSAPVVVNNSNTTISDSTKHNVTVRRVSCCKII